MVGPKKGMGSLLHFISKSGLSYGELKKKVTSFLHVMSMSRPYYGESKKRIVRFVSSCLCPGCVVVAEKRKREKNVYKNLKKKTGRKNYKQLGKNGQPCFFMFTSTLCSCTGKQTWFLGFFACLMCV